MLKNLKSKIAAGSFLASVSISSAFAATDVSAISELVTDVSAIGAAIMSVLVAIAGIKYIRRAL